MPHANRFSLRIVMAAVWLAGFAASQDFAAGETRAWLPVPSEHGVGGSYRREIELRTEGPCEIVVWAQAQDPGLRLRLEPGDGRAAIEHAATDVDPVAFAVFSSASAGASLAVLECEQASPVRFAWHALAADPRRRDELKQLRARVASLAPAEPSFAQACDALLDELLGPDGKIETWLGSQIAREIGERAARASLHDLVVRTMGHAIAFREALVPLRSKQLLEVRIMEARAMARTRRSAAARESLERLLPLLDELHGRGSGLSLGTRQDLAACLRTEGDLEGARDLYLESVGVADAELPDGHFEHIRLRHNAAVACFELSDFWRSLQLDQQALVLLREQARAIPDFERAIRLQLALTTRSLGTSVPDFEEDHRRVLAQLEDVLGETHADVLRLKSNLAGILADGGRHEPALPLAEEVLAARLETLGPTHPDTLFSRMRLAQVLNGLGDLDRGLALQQDVLALCEDTRPRGDPFLRKTRGAVVRTLQYLERTQEAEQLALDSIDGLKHELRSSMVGSWRERRERVADLRHDLLNLTRFGAQLDVGESWQVALFELIETARAASVAGPLRIAADEQERDLRELFDEHAASRRSLGDRAAAASTVIGTSARPAIESLVEARHELDAHERALARALAERGLLPFRSVDAQALASAVGPNAAAVGFTAFDVGLERPLGSRQHEQDLFFHVSLLAPDGRLRVRLVRSLCALETAIARWRASILVPVDDQAAPAPNERRSAEREAGAEILELLFGAWLGQLGPDVDSLYVCLEGAPALVPLDALAWGDGRVLGDRFRVRQLSSFDELTHARTPAPGPRRLFAVGGLDYGGASDRSGARFEPLPGSAEEIHTVAALFENAGAAESILLEGSAATRDSLRAALHRSTHALLATHGTFDDSLVGGLDGAVEGELSGQQIIATLAPLSLCRLALSDANRPFSEDRGHPGLWTGEEIAGEDLRGLQLVVLSACDTNRSLRRGGVGVLSLQSALHAAGARRSLTSLWRVKTDYGRLLIERFFREYLDGATASDALWRAKLFLREERGLPTRFWAGWTLSG